MEIFYKRIFDVDLFVENEEHKERLCNVLNASLNCNNPTHFLKYRIDSELISFTLKCDSLIHARSLYHEFNTSLYYNMDIDMYSVEMVDKKGLNCADINFEDIESFEIIEFEKFSKKGMSGEDFNKMLFNEFIKTKI